LCEATCGILVNSQGKSVTEVRGDPDDPLSQGYICAKPVGLLDVHHDPDRLTQPMRRSGGSWRHVGWREAIAEAVDRIAETQRRHGRDAVALYQGNPTLHHYATMLAGVELAKALGTRNLFSTASVDHQPHLFTAYQTFGNKALIAVPDIDRTDLLLLFGSNPLVSNGSMMNAPNFPARLARLRQRGGRLIVVDPRRTRTAEQADMHLAIPPGRDVLLLLAMVRTLFAEGRVRLGPLASLVSGLSDVALAVEGFAPERVAPLLGIDASVIYKLARDFAQAKQAACHGRLGVSTQLYGGLCCWLLLVLNVLTGRLDAEGGMMFPTPAVDLAALARTLGERGSYDRWRSRASGLPEFGGEFPLSTLAEEIETPGSGQVRGLITVAGNPVLSAPNGGRLERALPQVECFIAVDFYLNETTRHAHLILPGAFVFERDHFDLAMHALAVRDAARYCQPLYEPGPEQRQDWQILLDLAIGIARGRRAHVAAMRVGLLRKLTPRRLLAMLVRFGVHGAGMNPFGSGLTLGRLAKARQTLDLGPLRPGQLPRRLGRGGTIRIAPAPMLKDLVRVARDFFENDAPRGLVLVGGREQRSVNSWLHNAPRLVKGPGRCRLCMHEKDAVRLGLRDGELVRVRSRTGSICVPLEIDNRIRCGVVSLPHGYGHDRAGTRLRFAAAVPGASVNDITDEACFDVLTGTAAFNGLSVSVELADTPRDSKAAPAVIQVNGNETCRTP